VRYGALFFSRNAEIDFGSYFAPGLGLRIHPLADLGGGDLWIGGSGDLVFTGDLVRAGLTAGLGYELDLAYWLRVGPLVRFHHVFQPDDDPRGPADASFVSFGLSGSLFGDEERVEPEPEPPRVADADADGLTDADDACPREPEDRDGFQDEDGCPDRDNDADGVQDANDGCPNEPEDRDGFQDEDGCPDNDDDGDGIPDASDACRTQPETVNQYQDQDGCPDQIEREIAEVAERVYFATAQARIRSQARSALLRVVQILNAHPEITRLRIDGHADARGSETFNLDLSHRRALAVRDFLIQQGIAAERLEVAAYGERAPEIAGENERAHAANRRVQFTVIEVSGRRLRDR
jgi:outer membrane protein OmpA-like peptidoglycan-associated protein